MSIFTDHLISLMVVVPFLGIVILAIIRDQEWIRRVAFGCTMVELGLSLILYKKFDSSIQGMQFVERMEWMPTFNIHYAVGVDGISILLVLLTALLCPLCILCSWNTITTRVRAFMALILLVEGAMIVVFTALDLFLFFMLWEVTMIPMYFMIILWGGPNRNAAGIKFILYSLTGSLLLLLGILGLYLEGGHTFDLVELSNQTYSSDVQFWIFLAFFLAFAIKMPMVPFHTWLPDAHFRGSNGRQCPSRRGIVENGWVWIFAILFADVSKSLCPIRTIYFVVISVCHYLWWLFSPGANRSQETGGLLLRFSHGLCHTWNFCVQQRRNSRRDFANV